MNKLALDILAAIAAIATIIGVLLPILKKKKQKREVLKQLIKEKTDLIEQSFQPNNITIVASSTKDLQLIKDFQTTVLESIVHWKSISDMGQISDFKILNATQLLSTQLDQLNALNNFEKEINKIEKLLIDLSNYGKSNNIGYYVLGQDKLAALGTKQYERMLAIGKINNKVTRRCQSLLKKYPTGSIPRKKIMKALKPCEKYYNMVTSLEFLKNFYSLCAEKNENYLQYIIR